MDPFDYVSLLVFEGPRVFCMENALSIVTHELYAWIYIHIHVDMRSITMICTGIQHFWRLRPSSVPDPLKEASTC